MQRNGFVLVFILMLSGSWRPALSFYKFLLEGVAGRSLEVQIFKTQKPCLCL